MIIDTFFFTLLGTVIAPFSFLATLLGVWLRLSIFLPVGALSMFSFVAY